MKHYMTFIADTIRHYGNQPALSDYEGEVHYTYSEMAERVALLASTLRQLGIQQGDKVAICGRNSSNWGIAFLAIQACRGVVVSILPDFTSDSIYDLVAHSESRFMFVGSWVRGRIELDKMPCVETFFAIDDLSVMKSSTPIVEDQIQALNEQLHQPTSGSGDWLDNLFYQKTQDDVAIINYTSGSTGSPKGVMVTQHNLSSNVVFSQHNIANHPGQTVVSMLPLAHMFGLMYEFLYQLAGGTHIYFVTKSLTPALLMKAFSDVHPYMILTVPLVIEKIFKKKIFPVLQRPLVHALWQTPLLNLVLRRKVKKQLMDAFGGRLEFLIIGGAALNYDVEKCLHQIHFPYTCGYGMTECAPIICYSRWEDYKFRSCGRVVEFMELRIDSENPRKKEGEILVRGHNVMRGYYKNLQATDNVFTDDGWMRTGDIGLLDRKGNLFISGRSKNMILGASGQNIYPEEIEDKLNSLEGVAESVVVERDGKLVGLVFPERIGDWDLDKIKQVMEENLKKLNLHLPSFSKVSNIELVDKEFEKTPKKSIKRFLYK